MREMMLSGSVTFEDRGDHELKGVDGCLARLRDSEPRRHHSSSELDDRCDAEDQAVDAEWVEGACFEEAGQESYGQIGACSGNDAAHDHLAADAVAERAQQVGELVHAGREDDWCGK